MGTNKAWLDQVEEAALEPDLPICDAHHHLWGNRHGAIEPRYMLDELFLDLGTGHNIVSTVFVEAKTAYRADGPAHLKSVGEIEFINGLAALAASELYGKTRVAAGIIGHTDLTRGAATGEVLDAMIAAAPARFRGVRHSANWDADSAVMDFRKGPPGLQMSEAYRAGVRELAKRNLIFEAWCFHTQIPELTDLARAIPDVRIVLNHAGGPIGVGEAYAGHRAEILTQWKGYMAELATCPNVTMKLGGLFMPMNGHDWHKRPMPPTSDELAAAAQPYLDYLIETFGVDRCMFESNFPVEKVSCSYGVLWNAYKKIAKGCSAEEKARLFHDSAVAAYRVESPYGSRASADAE